MKKNIFSFGLISVLALYVLSSVTVFGQGQTPLPQNQPPGSSTVQVTGAGNIIAGDVAHARDDAIDDALRKAVQQALGTYLSSETMIQNYQMVEDNILTWTKGYVQNYKVLSENQPDASTVQVTVQATIRMDDLKNDAESLQNLIAKMGNPRIMVMIQEHNIGENYLGAGYFDVDMTSAETAMINVLMQKGIEVVDPSVIKRKLKKREALAALQGNLKAAAAIAHEYGAEVIILGKAMANVAKGVNLYGMKSCQADVTARAVNTDTGMIIATASAHSAKPHIDALAGGTMAIKEATVKTANQLIDKILKKWREQYYNATAIELDVDGFKNFNQLEQFKTTLKYYVRGIKAIFDRKFQGGKAILEVKMTGNTRQLARELSNKDLGKIQVSVLGVTPNSLELNVSQKEE
ncbi:hypothetical protein BMS3Abin05_00693 [bacterium BMS3Abin05]|nr:hypothetical protein BMS3Abin05_00693 [bacterium BMS3Abin05]GBE27883.1 hypothetical protein BMS3Bbin03_01814 [bacterium BMS3Bbin03]